jgi:hypothetical protein
VGVDHVIELPAVLVIERLAGDGHRNLAQKIRHLEQNEVLPLRHVENRRVTVDVLDDLEQRVFAAAAAVHVVAAVDAVGGVRELRRQLVGLLPVDLGVRDDLAPHVELRVAPLRVVEADPRLAALKSGSTSSAGSRRTGTSRSPAPSSP